MIFSVIRAQDESKGIVIIQLDPSVAMVYKIYVYNAGGLSAANTEEKYKINASERHAPITLIPPVPISNSTTSLNISGSKNYDQDLTSYKLFLLQYIVVSLASLLVTIISNHASTTHEDQDLKISKTLKFTWSKDEDKSFDDHVTYRSEFLRVVPAKAALVAILYTQNIAYYNDAILIKNKTYY